VLLSYLDFLASGVAINFCLTITYTPGRPELPCQPVMKWIPDWVLNMDDGAISWLSLPSLPHRLPQLSEIICWLAIRLVATCSQMIVLFECADMCHKLSNLWCQQWVSISVYRIHTVVQATFSIHTSAYWWVNRLDFDFRHADWMWLESLL